MADTGRYNIEAEERMPQKWYAGSMAQLMVFLSGGVLTLIVYLSLNVYVNGILEKEYNDITQDVYRIVSNHLTELENTIKAVGTIIELSPDKNAGSIEERILYAVPDTKNFERIMLLRKGKGEQWNLSDIKENDTVLTSFVFSKGTEQNIIRYLLENRPSQRNAVKIDTAFPGSIYIQEGTGSLIKARPFAVSVNLANNNKGETDSMIAGLVLLTTSMDLEYLVKQDTLLRLSIREENTEQRIFYMDRNKSGSMNDSDKIRVFNKMFYLGSSAWNIEIIARQSTQALFLGKIPWFILIFGVLLTLSGTLYVRNDQRQSYRLREMDRALAQKNRELANEASEREHLFQIMRKAIREHRAIVDSVSDIIFETSTEGEITFLNNTWRDVTGFDVEQGVGRNLFEMLHPEDQEEQKVRFDQLVKGQKQAYRTFTRLQISDRSYRSVELAVSMLRKDENNNIRVVGTITDVEEHRRAEKALDEVEEKYRAIVENAAGGIYQLAPEGHFLSANPAMARILGYNSPNQLIQDITNADEQIYENTKERSRFIHGLQTLGVVNNFETKIIRNDGVKIWVNENAHAVKDAEGNILYFEGSIEDITQRKETEIELWEAKIESDLANRAKSEFLANMSHELRTPLNAIIGFAEILKDEILGPIGMKQYGEYAHDIHESGNSLLAIITEILDVSRIEAGERQLQEAIVDMDKLMKSCLDIQAPKIEANNMIVTNTLEGSVPGIVGEELAIKQIILNLISNAVKFTPDGGRITFSYDLTDEGRLRISITDTGVGLDDTEIEKALSPFGQIETALNRSSSGTGLGLTLVASLMKLHGGQLELFSQKGIGTTATIIFPARRVVQDEENIPHAEEDEG